MPWWSHANPRGSNPRRASSIGSISRRHASLRVEKERVLLLDHGSRNGVRVNGERVYGEAEDALLEEISAELAAEAETGLDFCALFEGDVRTCAPIALNCQLVRYCEVLALIASKLRDDAEAAEWHGQLGR